MQNLGRVHVAAFSDETLYAEMVGKAAFWQQAAYFGLDLTTLYEPAMAGYFQQVCTGARLRWPAACSEVQMMLCSACCHKL